jgi:hypothetical protein
LTGHPETSMAEPTLEIQPEVVRSSYADVSARADAVRALYASRELKLHRDSSLGKLLRAANALSASWKEGERAGSIDAIMAASHANRISEAVLALADDPAAEQSLRRIAAHDMDLAKRMNSHGKNHLWELELCHFLRKRGVEANLVDPPDIVAQLGGQAIPIACKKIYSEKGVEAQMRKGVQQIAASGDGGFVALNIDDLAQENAVLNASDPEAASEFLFSLNMAFVERHRWTLQKFVSAGRCDGVIVSTSAVCDLKSGAPRFTTVAEATVWTLDSIAERPRARISLLRDALAAA